MAFLEDIAKESKQPFSLLVVGKTGTGKSSLLKQIALKAGKYVLLVGGDPADFKDVDHKSIERLKPDVVELKNCTCIIDDHFSLTKQEHQTFRTLLSFTKRHKLVNVMVGSHTLCHTGLTSLLGMFDYICFTNTKTNDANVRGFLRVIKDEDIKASDFKEIPEFGYLIWDNKKNEKFFLDSNFSLLDSIQDRKDKQNKDAIRKEIDSILQVYPENYKIATCLLDYLLKNIDFSILNKKN